MSGPGVYFEPSAGSTTVLRLCLTDAELALAALGDWTRLGYVDVVGCCPRCGVLTMAIGCFDCPPFHTAPGTREFCNVGIIIEYAARLLSSGAP